MSKELRQVNAEYDIRLYKDGTVTINGEEDTGAAVSLFDEIQRISLDGDSRMQVNPLPKLCDIHMYRKPGWQGNIGYRIDVVNVAEGETPADMALSVHDDSPVRNKNYLYTTGGFQLDAETGLWGADCPPGYEPGQDAIYCSLLYKSIKYAAWTLNAGVEDSWFIAGGDYKVKKDKKEKKNKK